MRNMSGGGRARALPRFLAAPPAVLLGLACHACAPDGADRDPPARSTAAAGTTARQDHQNHMPNDHADSLRSTLEMPERVPRGTPVPITFRIENVTDRTLTLHLTGRQIAFDIVVARPDGTTVWRRLHDEVIQAILRLDTLPPGDALVLEDTWDQRSDDGDPVPAGEYRVHGELLTEADPLRSPPETLHIAPA